MVYKLLWVSCHNESLNGLRGDPTLWRPQFCVWGSFFRHQAELVYSCCLKYSVPSGWLWPHFYPFGTTSLGHVSSLLRKSSGSEVRLWLCHFPGTQQAHPSHWLGANHHFRVPPVNACILPAERGSQVKCKTGVREEGRRDEGDKERAGQGLLPLGVNSQNTVAWLADLSFPPLWRECQARGLITLLCVWECACV